MNASPGLEGVETCTNLDIAGAIVEYIAARVGFPEIDVRQRLTVRSGYGVSEIHIPKGSAFEGLTITETQLRDNNINVLTVYRGDSEIPNPKETSKLEAEDRLLCFGKLDAMRGSLAPKSQRRRRPKINKLSWSYFSL